MAENRIVFGKMIFGPREQETLRSLLTNPAIRSRSGLGKRLGIDEETAKKRLDSLRVKTHTSHIEELVAWVWAHREELELALGTNPPSSSGELGQPPLDEPPLVVYEEHIVTCKIGQNCFLEEISEIRRLRILQPGDHSILISHVAAGSGDPRSIMLDNLIGCEKGDARSIGPRVVECDLRLSRRLESGDSHIVSFRKIVPKDHEPMPLYGVIATYPTTRLDVRVEFPHDLRPAAAWRMDGLEQLEVPGFPQPHNNTLVDRLGYAADSFFELEKGLCYGLAWQWS